METILKTKNLSKIYKGQYAVNNVNMTIEKGDIYGFVGENGSGKTTIIRLITGLIFPSEGGFELFGVKNNDLEINKVKTKIGAIVETPSIYLNFSAYENLKIQSQLLGINDESKIIEALNEVGLEDVIHSKKKASNFSLGMRQRLGIAMALLNGPEFIILDEPMNGLDPAGIVSIRELILKLNQERHITFLISSHILTELSLVATKYGIISKGRLIREITNEELNKECRKSVNIIVDDTIKLMKVAVEEFKNCEYSILPNGLRIYGDIEINDIVAKIVGAGIKIEGINYNQANIEEYYLSLLGGKNHG